MEKLKKINRKGREGQISTDLTIGPNDGYSRSREKAAAIASVAKLHQSKHS